MIISFIVGFLLGYICSRVVITIRPEDDHISEQALKNIHYDNGKK